MRTDLSVLSDRLRKGWRWHPRYRGGWPRTLRRGSGPPLPRTRQRPRHTAFVSPQGQRRCRDILSRIGIVGPELQPKRRLVLCLLGRKPMNSECPNEQLALPCLTVELVFGHSPSGTPKTASDLLRWSGRRDSNPRPQPWQGGGFCPRGSNHSPGLLLRPPSFHCVHRIRPCCRAVYYPLPSTKRCGHCRLTGRVG
jgi:hypothetical protein